MSQLDPLQNNDELEAREEIVATPQFINRFLEVQSAEIEVKLREFEVKHAEIACQKEDQQHNKEIAMQSIAAQLEDQKLKQKAFLSANNNQFWLIVIGIIAVTAFLIYAMSVGKESFAAKIFDLAIGAIGGFAAGKFSESSRKKSDN